MRHVIYVPADGEVIPDCAMSTEFAGEAAVSALVPDDFVTAGTIHYDCLDGVVTQEPSEPIQHTYAGWPT